MAMSSDGDLSRSLIAGSELVFDYFCQPCDNIGKHLEAVGYCVNCEEFLCSNCFKYHKRQKMAKDHTLQDKDQMLQNKGPAAVKDTCTEKCERHQDELVKYYCPAHDVTGCGDCITLDHRNCDDVKLIVDIATDIINSKEYKDFDSKLQDTIQMSKDIKSETKQKTDLVDRSSAQVKEDLQKFRKEVNDALDQLENDLDDKIEQTKQEKLKQMSTISNQCVATQTEAETIVSQLLSLQKKGQHSNMYIIMKKTKKKMDTLDQHLSEISQSQTVQKFEFRSNQDLLTNLRKPGALGEVSLRTPSMTGAVYLRDINVKCESDLQQCCITGSTILSDRKLVMCDYNNKKIKIIDRCQNKMTEEIAVPCAPWDVTKISDSQVAVTIPHEKKILILKVEPTLATERYIATSDKCCGIVYSKDKLYVIFPVVPKVEVMDMTGTVLREITTDNKGQEIFDGPHYITLSPDNTSMYVSNCGNSTLVRLGLDGKLLSTYKDKHIKDLRTITVDRNGMVYVCGKDSHNVHQITSDCQKGKILLSQSDGLRSPLSISLCNKTARLYVGMWYNDNFKVFKASYD